MKHVTNLSTPKIANRIKGSASVRIDFDKNIKTNFTIGLTISSGWCFFKPLIITKGKQKNVWTNSNWQMKLLEHVQKKDGLMIIV